MRVRVEVHLLVVGVPEPPQRPLVRSRPGDRGTEQPDDGGALRAAEMRVASGDHLGRDAALPVRRAGERHQAPLAGHDVANLDGVADGEDVGVARAHLVVDPDAAELSDLDARRRGERGVGPHPEGEDHEVRRVPGTGLGRDDERSTVCLFETGDPVADHHVHAVQPEEVLHELAVLVVERGEHLVGQLDDGHVEVAIDQVLGRLQPDEPATDDHGSRLGRTVWNPE